MDVPVSSAEALPRPSQTVPLARFIKLLRRYFWVIALFGLLGTAVAAAIAFQMPKTYTATTAIAVEGDRFAIPELQGALRSENSPDPMPWVRTEVQALSSRDLLLAVINKLQLQKNPEFNGGLRPPTPLQRAKDAIKSLLPARSGGPPASADDATIDGVTKALSIFQDNRSLVIGISFTAQDPAVAAEFANTLVADYVASRAKRRIAANQGANATMVQRIDQVRNDLSAIEQKMRDLRSTGESVGLRAGSVGQQQLEELATAAARAGLERAQLETTWSRATALARQGSSDALANVLGSQTVSRLREQEGQALRRMAELSSRYGSDHPSTRSAAADLSSARRQISEETQRIVASLGTQLRVAREQEADIQKQLATARGSSVQAENVRAQLDQLQQEAATRRNLYQNLLERAQQTVAQPNGSEIPDVRVLNTASPPSNPSGPATMLASALGGVGGTMLGCLLVLGRINSMTGFSTPAEVTEATGLPVAAILPRSARRRGRSALSSRVVATPGGPEAEAMRVLRARLRRVGRTSVPRSVVFTSVTDGELAAQTAAAFARVVASGGERVLLVDGNLQEPSLGRILGARAGGLIPVLMAKGDWRDALTTDTEAQVDLLLASEPSADAHTLLSGVCLRNLLVEAEDEYDLVVIDAPLASSSDALTLAHRTDAAVLVVDGRGSKRLPAREAATKLSTMSRSPLIAVMVAP